MTKVISFANNKGGSGKSTTCSSVGYALAEQGKKVLLIDGVVVLPRRKGSRNSQKRQESL